MIPPETAPTADRRVEVPAPLLPYALLLAWCWLRDAILFAQYLAASPGTLPPWASDALAGLATLALAWGARKFLRPRFAARDLLPAAVMFLPVLLLAVARTPIPDSNFDTYAYHLYAQQFNFSDAARGFLSAGKNTFLFPLADRMFLPVRALLGYRAGTVLNVLMLGVIVLQVVQLLRDWLTREGVQPSGWLLAAGAAAAVGTEYALINVGTYLVDLLPVPLMLEALRLALDDGDNPRDVPYLAALSGFCLALKLTGVVFLAPLVAVFLLRRWRCLCVGNVAAGLILFCLPAAIYALFAWRETGNPVFWMFNEVFRSDFFLTINFRDTRWGPRGWIEKLTWPVVVLFHPERFSELARCTGRLAMLVPLGLAWAGAVWALRKTSPPVPRRLGWLLAAVLLCVWGWSATTGYCRYAIFPEMLTGLGTVWLAWRLLARRRLRAVAVGLLLILAAQCAAAGYYVFVRKMDWSWRDFYSLKHKQFPFARQWRLVGRDHDSGVDAGAIGAWINPCASSGYEVLIRPDVPMFGLECANFSPPGRKVFEQRLAALGDAPLYAAVEWDSFGDAVRAFDRFAFRIVEMRPVRPRFVSPGRRVLLMRLARDPARTLRAFHLTEPAQRLRIDLPRDGERAVRLWMGYRPDIPDGSDEGLGVDVRSSNVPGKAIYRGSFRPDNGLTPFETDGGPGAAPATLTVRALPNEPAHPLDLLTVLVDAPPGTVCVVEE